MLILMIIISSVTRQRVCNVAVNETAATASQAADARQEEMRGVWITFMDLSMEYESNRSEAAFREKFEKIAADCAGFGFNTLIVQVRPFADALYSSKLFPPSHILSGEQGKSAGYDALEIICEICRAKGLSIHAWVNPYRVTADKTPQKLSADNPYSKDGSLGIQTDSGIIFDPSNEEARKLIVDGVREIVENYPVDGVQFDDYFYPEDIGDADEDQYSEYLKTVSQDSAMDLQTWRTFNVSLLISETYLAVHKCRENALFGISPQGNLENNSALCADVVNWCEKRGFIDYICPQIYFSTDHPYLPFETALNEWSNLNLADGVRLFVGLAGYKAGTDADDGTWLGRGDILTEEYKILSENKKVSGFMLYSYASLNEPSAEKEMTALKEILKADRE